MEATNLGIGLVGLGGIAQTHLTAYQKFGLRVVAGCDLDPRRLEQARRKWQIPQLTDDLAALLANPAVRVVDVNIPHYAGMREPVFEAAGAAGKAIYVQKPLAQTLAEARTLVAIAEHHGVPLMVNQNSLFAPAFQLLKRHLDRGTIGTPYYFQIENRGFWRAGHPHFGRRERWVMSDMGIHHYALAQHWFGTPELVWATTNRDPSQPELVGENVGVVSLTYPGALRGLIVNNWSFRGPERLRRAHSHEDMLIQGANGAISGHSDDLVISTLAPEPAHTTPVIEGPWFPDAFGHAMRHFLECVAAGREPISSGRTNLIAVATFEAAYQSAASGQPVRVPDLLGTG